MIELIIKIILDYFVVGLAIFIVALPCFWIFEIFRKLPKPFNYILAPIWIPAGLIGYPLDLFFNVFYATIIFWDWPDIHDKMDVNDITLSHRLRQIFRYDTKIMPTMIRWKIAEVMCWLIELADCKHCGRN